MDDNAKKPEPTPCQSPDELVAGPALPDGARPFVRHTADHKIQAGIMRPVVEGEPLYNGAFALEHKEGDLYRVHEVTPHKADAATDDGGHKGPARVNSRAYQSGWDAIFGKKATVGQA